jgi:hypothetical protein
MQSVHPAWSHQHQSFPVSSTDFPVSANTAVTVRVGVCYLMMVVAAVSGIGHPALQKTGRQNTNNPSAEKSVLHSAARWLLQRLLLKQRD